MKQTYDTGIATNQINLGVTAGTVGTAYTSVTLVNAAGQSSKIAESDQDSGNISERTIGTGGALKNSYVVIRTTIDLSNIDPSLWPGQQQNLAMRYQLTGGFSGSQTFIQEADDVVASPDGKTLVVSKAIQLL